MMNSIELFAGAGGLALGTSRAGFHHEAVIEWNKNACATLRTNQIRGVESVSEWNVIENDVSEVELADFGGGIALISGGPPCQPFSIGGKHKGRNDKRDMFPEAIKYVARFAPQIFIFENVKGLLRKSFARYLEYVLLRLTYPNEPRLENQDWIEHLACLERLQTNGEYSGLSYNVIFQLLDAAQFGVPQKRERVFIVGFRSDLGIKWSFPRATHSENALLYNQWVSGDYWDKHEIATKNRPDPPERKLIKIKHLERDMFPPTELPLVTVRDAILGLPDPERPGNLEFLNHQFRPGAKKYPGHTGSPLDLPAKTLKAGVHGVPGGENMMILDDGSVRYFTVREAARLQTFPDDYEFSGAWSEAMRQLGNAVPVKLAEFLAKDIASVLRSQIAPTIS